jgi:hypothetical protein
MVLAVIYAVRRYRSRAEGYVKVNTGAEIPLEMLDYRDDVRAGGEHAEPSPK